jgi:hypothetical protein
MKKAKEEKNTIKKQLSDHEMKTYNILKSWYKFHKKQYKCCQITGGISLDEQGERIIAFSVIFLNTSSKKNEILEYPGLKLLKIYMPVDKGMEIIKKMIFEDKIEFNDISLSFEGKLRGFWRHDGEYNSTKMSEITKWPGKVFTIEIKKGQGNGPGDVLLKLGNPIYTSTTAALREWIGKKHYNHDFHFRYKIGMILPDYTARMKSIKLHSDTVNIQLEKGDIKFKDLILKYYFTNEKENVQKEKKISKSELSIPLKITPTIIYLYLINKIIDEKIDWREIHLDYDKEYKFPIEQEPETLKYLLESGEGPYIEFKHHFQKGREFLESVAAFANTNGGRIFVGVDDNGNVIDIKGSCENLINSIQESIKDGIEPSLTNVNVKSAEIDGKTFVIIEIAEGDDKPYMLMDGGIIYIRAGATDKRARRIDLERLYQEKPNLDEFEPYSPW